MYNYYHIYGYNASDYFNNFDINIYKLFSIIAIILVIVLFFKIFIIICNWKIFKKAGKEGWEAIIPIYNKWVFFEITGLNGWFVLLNFIPVIGNLIYGIFIVIANYKLSQSFKKPAMFTLGLLFIPFVFYPILAFGKETYSKPKKIEFSL